MSVTDIFKVNEIKAQRDFALRQLAAIKQSIAETEKMEFHELKQAIEDLKAKYQVGTQAINRLAEGYKQKETTLTNQIKELNAQIEARKKEVIFLDDEILLQSFGFYKQRYNLGNSELYKQKLDEVRNRQEEMVKAGTAVFASTNWTVNNDQKEGARMIKDYVKLILRSFNNECDTSIANVKFNNIESVEKKIKKAFETLNNLGRRMTISIYMEYLNLKLQELYLVHEYQIKKQEEKEDQKRIREQMREEAKLLKEIEEIKSKIEKEEKHFSKALDAINEKLSRAQSEAEIQLLEKEKISIEQQLVEVEKDKQDVFNREKNTRAGYVYVISNMGAFGENIYKIGVTRRLDPTERVDELGDASVPFDFDIHATIFSEDAPALENALHKAFEHKRLNMINYRREFFHVTLEEIEEVVKKNFEKPVEFTLLADAQEYRQSLALHDNNVN
jgi:hypothetical protein